MATPAARLRMLLPCWLGLLACAWAGLAAAGPVPPAGPGASRQAWASAAALSRGIQFGGFMADRPGDPRQDEQAVEAIVKAGFRSVHLPVRSDLLADAGADAPIVRRLDDAIDAFLAHGLMVVLDIQPGRPAPGASPRSAGLNALWRRAAVRLRSRPDRLLFNVAVAPSPALPPQQANRLLGEVLKTIREVDPRRIVIAGWGDPIGLDHLVLPPDPHLIVGVAHVEPYRFTRQGVPGLAGADQWRGTGCCTPQETHLMSLPLDVAKTWSVQQRRPVWVSAFMSSRQAPLPLRVRHARLLREAAEARGLSWAYGDFSGDFGIYDPAARAWQPLLLDALLGP